MNTSKHKPAKMRALTYKQALFTKEYMVDMCATQAAIRAGYSRKTADRIGPELLKKPWVARGIQAAMAKKFEKTEITADAVLDGIMRTIRRCDEAGQHHAVLKGYELLGRHLKLFTDKTDVEVNVTQIGLRYCEPERSARLIYLLRQAKSRSLDPDLRRAKGIDISGSFSK